MKSFDVEAEISGKSEKLHIVPDIKQDIVFRVIKDGVEICTLKENGAMGWEVNGTPLDAEELNIIGTKIKEHLTR